MSQYKLLNKELTLEVQKLRVHLREFEKSSNELRHENKEIRAENAILRSYIAQNFQFCSTFSQKFSSAYIDLINRGIQISLPEVSDTRQSTSVHRRLSSRNSLVATHQNFIKSPVKRNVPDAVYPTSSCNDIRRRNLQVETEVPTEEPDDERAAETDNHENVPKNVAENLPTNANANQLFPICEEASGTETNFSVTTKTPRKGNTSRKALRDISNEGNSMVASSYERETTPENYLEDGDISMDVRNNIISVACSTPIRKKLSEPKILIEKVRLSAEDLSEYASNFQTETSSAIEPKKKTQKNSSDRSVARRSSGRPKRTARPKEGTMAEKTLKTKLRRTE